MLHLNERMCLCCTLDVLSFSVMFGAQHEFEKNVVNQSYWDPEKLIAAKMVIGNVRVVVSMTNEQRICKA